MMRIEDDVDILEKEVYMTMMMLHLVMISAIEVVIVEGKTDIGLRAHIVLIVDMNRIAGVNQSIGIDQTGVAMMKVIIAQITIAHLIDVVGAIVNTGQVDIVALEMIDLSLQITQEKGRDHLPLIEREFVLVKQSLYKV